MYILLLDDWKLSRMKQTKDVRMYIEEFILVEYLDTLLYKLELSMELNMHWKCCSLYTIATMEEKCENCS